MTESVVDRIWAGGWRGPLFAALVAFVAALPGLVEMPVLDRDEARFAQASAQMIETHDLVTINFQDEPRAKKPAGIYWLQASSVAAFSSEEARQIWAYRLPSLLGAMAAAAACAWGAAAFLGPRGGAIAGAVLGASLLLSTEGFIGKTDAALCGSITLMMAALARIYAASLGEGIARTGTKVLFWLGLALSLLLKGPIGPMVAATTIAALWIWDRRAPWLAGLGWSWGIALVLLVVGPWAMAVTVATDGAFWTGAVMGDMVSKLGAGRESHGAPPGLHALLTPLLIFPATVLLPAGMAHAWKWRQRLDVRFAVCWLLPSWIVFELTPTKLPHYPLPLYGALAWLIAGALAEPIGRVSRWVGAGLGLVAAAALAAAGLVLALRFGDAGSLAWAVAAAVLLTGAAAGAVALILFGRRSTTALAAALGLGVLAHDAMAGGLAPRLQPLWVSSRLAEAVKRAGLDPRDGVIPGPIGVAGYAEPSLVFLLGTRTELGDSETAAMAIADGRPAIVEVGQQAAFFKALQEEEVKAAPAAEVKGLDYSKGKPVDLVLYRSLESGGAP